MANSDRPASHQSRKVMGLLAKEKASKSDTLSIVEKQDKKKAKLVKELLKDQPKVAKDMFVAFSECADLSLAKGLVGMVIGQQLHATRTGEDIDHRSRRGHIELIEALRRLIEIERHLPPQLPTLPSEIHISFDHPGGDDTESNLPPEE